MRAPTWEGTTKAEAPPISKEATLAAAAINDILVPAIALSGALVCLAWTERNDKKCSLAVGLRRRYLPGPILMLSVVHLPGSVLPNRQQIIRDLAPCSHTIYYAPPSFAPDSGICTLRPTFTCSRPCYLWQFQRGKCLESASSQQ